MIGEGEFEIAQQVCNAYWKRTFQRLKSAGDLYFNSDATVTKVYQKEVSFIVNGKEHTVSKSELFSLSTS